MPLTVIRGISVYTSSLSLILVLGAIDIGLVSLLLPLPTNDLASLIPHVLEYNTNLVF